jgi:terminase small subunit / prophage DNA-packing protein
MNYEQKMMADLGFAPEATELDAGSDLIKVDAATLAKAFGVTTRQITALATDGVVVKTARATFDLLASTQNYIEKLRKPDGGSKERLTAFQADLVELKLNQQRGELVPVAQVQHRWASILQQVKAVMLGVPAKIQADLPHLTVFDAETIDKRIRAALTDLGESNGND